MRRHTEKHTGGIQSIQEEAYSGSIQEEAYREAYRRKHDRCDTAGSPHVDHE